MNLHKYINIQYIHIEINLFIPMLSICNKALSITYRRLCSSYPTLWAMQLVARTFECECWFFDFHTLRKKRKIGLKFI